MIWIPGEVPSKKNSKKAYYSQKEGKIRVSSSDFTLAYEKAKRSYGIAYWRKWLEMVEGKPYPLTIEFFFIRRTEAEFDYNNISQVLLDLMQEWEWLPGDSMLYVIPDFSRGYAIDKNNPGVEITVK